ncbi:nicotinate phosphoribosyltransferase [Mycoplasmopsis columbinasalis]|uniref:nicotinate phosphoribosyltransferase n=1 Tax=Mycoplasmopsis columbinasalis TaxID=114880 RepID=A0A449BAQ8_9BACT|nr:nicotinate phosphoribosyltransferase [Mycoplasmopsis columbinasalis]VEU78293.1 nicotinate phosphoribosyltransferase [Mycoplasmopsis columbinasalis]
MKQNLDKYIASCFLKTTQVLEKFNPNNVIKLQFFQRQNDAILSGMDEVLELLQTHTDTSKYKIKYLPEGSKIDALEVVLELEGNYQWFGKYEGMIDGILSRMTSLATNAHRCVSAAKGKPIIFMGDRMDHYLMQERDGKAVKLGGVNIMSTWAQNHESNTSPFDSIPHAMIQNFGGSLKDAMLAYAATFPDDKIIALIDYHNNVVAQAKEVWEALGDKLWGVRIDTSKNMKDHMFDNVPDDIQYYGVNVTQVKNLRNALNKMGAKDLKIVVSSGFDYNKIAAFEAANTPVDFYGVGQSLFKLICSFSADATVLNGLAEAKEGRSYRPNPRLKEFN